MALRFGYINTDTMLSQISAEKWEEWKILNELEGPIDITRDDYLAAHSVINICHAFSLDETTPTPFSRFLPLLHPQGPQDIEQEIRSGFGC